MLSIIKSQTNPSTVEVQSAQCLNGEFSATKMDCQIENLFQDGDWAILEWRDPLGLRGCGFFRIEGTQIVFQRGYWDKLSFLKLHGLPL